MLILEKNYKLKKSIRILFRVSGGMAPKTELGMGHIFRALNLAKECKFAKIIFLLEDFGKAEQIVRSKGYTKIYKIQKNCILKDDVKKTLEIIKIEKIDLTIVDKYGPKLSNQYLKKIKEFTKIILITDLNKINFDVDLLVNGFVGYKNIIKENKFGARCLLGPNYQILDKKFATKKLLKKKYFILATFGGYDENELAKKFVKAVTPYLDKIKVKVILGNSKSKISDFKDIQQVNKNSLEIIQYSKNMSKDMRRSQYGLCAGGITTYEFASLKIPFGIISQVPHQLKTAKEWEKIKVAKNLGLVNKKIIKKISEYIEKCSKNKFKTNKKIQIDVNGSKRVIHEMLRMLKQ